jgi:hypothetical protein
VSPLERALVDLGRHLRYPEEDLAPAVVARLRRPEGSRPPLRMAVLAAATVALLVGGLATLSPVVRAAVLRTFLVPGIRILAGQPDSNAPLLRLGRGLDLGEAVTLPEARAGVDFPIRLLSALGTPDRVFLERDVPGGRVWLVYRARGEIPRSHETGVGVLVTQFRAGIDEDFLKKVQAEGGSVLPVQVHGTQGYWIQGAHSLFFIDESGLVVEDRTRVAGNVLVWEANGVTYRIESALGLADTLRLVRSF